MAISNKFKKHSKRKKVFWTPLPDDDPDFIIEFREPGGAFMLQVGKKAKEDKAKKKEDSSAIDGIEEGFLLMAETVYIDGKKEFESGPQAQAYFTEGKEDDGGGAMLMMGMLSRSAKICGMTKKDLDDAIKNS